MEVNSPNPAGTPTLAIPMTYRHKSLKVLVKLVRPLRPFLRRPQGVVYLHYATGLFILCFLASILTAKKWGGWTDLFMILVALFSGLAFLLETQAQAKVVFAHVWAKTAGKVFFGVLVLLANYVATSQAKNVVHALVHVDPKYFTEYLGIVSLGFTVLLFLALIQFGIALIGLVRLLFSYLVMGFQIVANPFVPRAFDFVWRIIFGARTRFSSFKHSLFATSSFIGSVALLTVLSYPVTLLARNPEPLSKALAQLLVTTEYRSGSSCINLSPITKVAYLDRGFVSVADVTPKGSRFSVDQCIVVTNLAANWDTPQEARPLP